MENKDESPIKLDIEIGNLTEEQAKNVIDMFNKWKVIIGDKDSRWTSFYIPKDFNANILINTV